MPCDVSPMYEIPEHGWLSSSCPPHEILYGKSLDLQWISVPKAVTSLHPFCLNGFDFIEAFFTVYPDLSMTFTYKLSVFEGLPAWFHK